jgi:hypothetical protein
LNITGNAVGNSSDTGIDTINVNFTTAQTFTSGSMAPGAASTITAAASTVGVTMDLTAYQVSTSLGVTDGPGNDLITFVGSDTVNALTTISLASGGADTIAYTNTFTVAAAASDGQSSGALTITNFTGGTSSAADKLSITVGAAQTATFRTLAAGNTVVPLVNGVYVIPSSIVTVSDFTAVANGGAVDVAIATAVNGVTTTAVNAVFVLYGSGANAGRAGVYSNLMTAATATSGNMAQELIAVITLVGGADTLVQGNFI